MSARSLWVILCACIPVLGCTPALDWREVTMGVGATIYFPCKPSRAVRSVPLAGQTVEMELRACDASEATWAVACAHLERADAAGPALDELRRTFLANIRGPERTSTAASAAGMTPHRESVLVTATGVGVDGRPVQAMTAVAARGPDVCQVTRLAYRQDDRASAEGGAQFMSGLRWPG